MKKILSFLLTFSILTMTIGCAQSSLNEGAVGKKNLKVTEEAVSKAEEESKTEESASKAEEKSKSEESALEAKTVLTFEGTQAQEFVAKINVGWNLGNSLDAHGVGNSLNSETYWGNPKTTHEMIVKIEEEGFNTIRIPITFAEHMIDSEYTIDPAWMDRVEEVVKYAYDDGMFVIIDTHHEPNYWLIPQEDKEEEVTKELTRIWEQVAERFKDYDERLIFEGMNEPRTVGSPQEWNGGTASEREVVNRLNQAFVDTVRNSGGNNQSRYLIVCTYGNMAASAGIRGLVVPNDSHIIVSVHMYTPYLFCYKPAGNYSVWDGSKIGDIQSQVRELKENFYDKGIPVIITEFGAMYKNNEDDVVKWIHDFMSTINEYGFKCIWWDNGDHSMGETFGIFNRRTLEWYSKKTADALIENAVCE